MKKYFSIGSTADQIRESLQMQYADIVNSKRPGSIISYRDHVYYLWVRKKYKREAQEVAKRMRRYGFNAYIHEMGYGAGFREYYVFVRLKK